MLSSHNWLASNWYFEHLIYYQIMQLEVYEQKYNLSIFSFLQISDWTQGSNMFSPKLY